MAPQISKTSGEPTLYDILALTPKHLEGQATSAQQRLVKQAYHRALLKHHPDKNNPSASSSSLSPPPPPASSASTSKSKSKSKSKPSKSSSIPTSSSSSPPGVIYTVDQIQQAYGVLSNRQQRASYDRSLREASASASASASAATVSATFRTGVVTVDLDDLGFDEHTGVYYRGCRCGNARGYAFTEANLEEFEDDGVLMVECLDCSLWLRVLFASAAEDDDDDNSVAVPSAAAAGVAQGGSGSGRGFSVQVQGPGTGKGGNELRRRGSSAGSTEGKGWKFNWSFSWGVSVSGSAGTGTGTGSGAGR